MAPSPSELAAAAAQLRRQEFARLSEAVTPRIEVFRSMTGDLFRNEIAVMLDRLGRRQQRQRHCDDQGRAEIHRRLRRAARQNAGQDPGLAPPPQCRRRRRGDARHLCDPARIFARGRALRGERVRSTSLTAHCLSNPCTGSRKGILLPSSYKAMCQCGDIVQHQLDQTEARPC
jgi:hypothetical protein